ncbi:PqqD family protein [Sphingobacterium suaedae]|uniref:PqqD family protein n=1 Tax=Sphingobacterium suaedae TaxID=1686402 RepID=A0ABW5KN52_9SPHI
MKLRKDLRLRHLGGEHVIVEPALGMEDLSNIHTLNDTAAYVWEALQDKEFTIASVTEVLLDRYDVTEAIAASDAAVLVRDFEKRGLLTS